MTRKEAIESIGRKATVNGSGDYAMEKNMRRWIYEKIPVTIERLTKGGKVMCQGPYGERLSIPPKNLDVIVNS